MPVSAMRLAYSRLDGSDIMIKSPSGRAGTLGLLVQGTGDDRRHFGVTSAHVVCEPGDDGIGSPIEAHIGSARSVIGRVAYQTRLKLDRRNNSDVALIALNEDSRGAAASYEIEDWFDQKVRGRNQLSASSHGGAMKPHYYSASGHNGKRLIRCSAVTEIGAAELLDQSGQKVPFARLFHLVVTEGEVRAGHSGALIVRAQSDGSGLLAVGLVVGGQGRDLLAISWTEVSSALSSLGVSVES